MWTTWKHLMKGSGLAAGAVIAAVWLSSSIAASEMADPPDKRVSAEPFRETIMHVIIGTHRFVADLDSSEAAQQLRALLPLSLEMQDHLHNEKHAPLPRRLSRADRRVGRIEAGDILLWQGDTIVLFYESFDSAYSYTRLGRLQASKGLKAALGAGNVRVRLEP